MDSTDEPHVRLSLGLYLLGAVDAAERATIERHLAGCDACRAESEELAGTVAAVALIPDEDRQAIAAEFGIPRPPAAPPEVSTASLGSPPPPLDASAAPAGSPLAPPEVSTAPPAASEVPAAPEESATAPAAAGDGPTGAGRVRSAAPATRPASRRPRSVRPGRSRPRRRTRGLVGIGSLVLVVLVSAGIFVGVAVSGRHTDPQRHVAISLAATAATTTGATLSAVAVSHGDGITVRAAVGGLRPGTRYQLVVVAADGDSHVVATWTASGQAREVTGEAPVAVSELAFFTVARADGTPVVSAAVPR
ncbi:MAG TPA: zf-HC2 domain-containing protein [Actinocatenispora sp.]